MERGLCAGIPSLWYPTMTVIFVAWLGFYVRWLMAILVQHFGSHPNVQPTTVMAGCVKTDSPCLHK